MTRRPGRTASTAPLRDDGRPAPSRLRVSAALLAVAGLLAVASAYSPWWYLTDHAGTSSEVAYYPGGQYYVEGGGGGGPVPYGTYGLGSIGELYGALLVALLLLTLVSWVLAGFAVARARGRAGTAESRRLATAGLVASALLAGLLALIVPLLQPWIYSEANPGGSCSSAGPSSPCASFWGSSTTGGAASVWGAGGGWWLDVTVAGLLGVALVLGGAAWPRPDAVPRGTPAGPGRSDRLGPAAGSERGSPPSGNGSSPASPSPRP